MNIEDFDKFATYSAALKMINNDYHILATRQCALGLECDLKDRISMDEITIIIPSGGIKLENEN